MAETIVVTYQFVGQGQDAVLAMVDAINARLTQTAGAVSDSFAQIAKVGEGGGHGAGGGGEGAGDGVHAHVVEKGHVEELGKAALVANRSFEVLKVGIEGIGQALISGSLQSSIGAFQRFGSSVGEATGIAEGFLSKFGLVGVIGSAVAGALGGMTVLFNELAQHMSENVLEFTELAKAAGMSTQQFANLEGAFLRAGVGMEQLHQIVRVTSNRIQAEWGDISRTVRDSADRQEEEGFRIEDANRKVADSYTMPAEAARKIEGAQLGAQTAKAAIPEAERTKESTELELFKAQLEYKRKYDESGHVRQTPLPVSPDDQLRLQEMERHADASHIEALRAREAEDDRNIKRAKMGAEAAQEQEAAIERNAFPEAREGMERAPMEARAAQRAQFDSLMKDPRNLAAAIRAGGEGVDWRTVAAPDIFRALTYMGGGTMMGTLSAASQFMNMPAVQGENFGATRSAVAQQFGARGNIAPIEEAIRKGEFQTVTPETLKTGAAMETALPDAEKVRDAWSTAAQEVRLGGIEAGKAFTPVAESTARGLGSIVENLGTKVKESVDAVSGIFGSITESGRGVISVFNAIGGGAKVTPDRFRPEKEAEVTGKITGNVVDAIKGAVTPTADFAHRFQPPGAAATGVPVNITTPVVNVNAGKTEGAPTHAYGGYITGPGTGTSDSIRAPWLSNGEYVIRADSVARVGVPFLDAINQGRGFFGGGPVGYADGGLVDPGAGSAGDDSNSLKPYTPSWSERLRYAVQDIMSGMGASKGYSQEFAEKAETLAGGAPVVGQAISVNEAVRAYQRGDKIGTVLGSLGALPIPGAAIEGGAARAVEAGGAAAAGVGIGRKTAELMSTEDKIRKVADKVRMFYRGVSPESGSKTHAQGKGLYFTASKDIAKDYVGPEGRIVEVPAEHLPSNPIRFRNEEEFDGWWILQAEKAGVRLSEWNKLHPDPADIVKSLGYDGVKMARGKRATYVNFNGPRITFETNGPTETNKPGYADGGLVDPGGGSIGDDSNSLKPYTPSWSERLRYAVQDIMSGMGASKGYSQEFAEKAETLAGGAPVVGQAISANEAYRSYMARDYVGAGLSGLGVMAMFGGPAAKTADLAALEVAKGMMAKGAAREEILSVTKWFQGVDKKWRFEIPDQSEMHLVAPLPEKGETSWLDKTVSSPKIKESYPTLFGGTEIQRGSLGRGMWQPGNVEPAGGVITPHTLSVGPGATRSTMLHEMQHGIQREEDFATGGNTLTLREGTPAWKIYQERLVAMRTPLSLEDFSKTSGYDNVSEAKNDYEGYLKIVKNPSPMHIRAAQDYAVQEAYRRTAGEVEARNVQVRMNMTPEERAMRPPWETQDVPDELQIVKFRQGYADGGLVDDATDAARQGHLGELKPYTPSWSERIRATVQDLMSGMGASRGYSQEFGEKAETLAGFSPAIGQAISANEGYRAYQSGNKLGAVLGALGALPIPGAGVAHAAEKGAQKTIEGISEKWALQGVKLDISPGSGTSPMVLGRIVIPQEQRSQGIGSSVMGDIIAHADAVGKTVALTPSTDFGGSSVSRLRDFYKRFGFVENKGKNKDFAISESMIRAPQNVRTEQAETDYDVAKLRSRSAAAEPRGTIVDRGLGTPRRRAQDESSADILGAGAGAGDRGDLAPESGNYALGGIVGGGHVGYAEGGLVDLGGGASGDDDSFKPMTSADILAGKAGPVQEARPYTDPTLGGFIGRLFEHGVERLGAGMSIIRRAGEIGETVGGVTGVDMPFHVKQAIRRGQHGDYLGAGLEALGALPTIPAAGIGRGVARAAEKDAETGLAKLGATPEPSILAYHGSPHDFEKFSSEHIGKGEGAQSYGHGLYFAESEGVARSYRDNLSASQMEIEGKPFTPGNYAITEMVASGKGDLPTLGENLRRYAEEGKTNPFSNHEDAIKIADSIQQGKFTVGELGHMYQVRIAAKPEHFLDWDKPLSGQHERVREAISTYYPQPTTRNIGHNQNLGENLVDLNVGKASVGVFPESKIPTDSAALKHMAMMNDPRTGEGWYREISKQVAAKEQARQPNFDVYSPHDASQALRTAGIPGIRYLDQGSRNQGRLPWQKGLPEGWSYYGPSGSVGIKDARGLIQTDSHASEEAAHRHLFGETPTHNYVVFDENLISIEKKYAIGGMVGGGFSSSSFSFGGADSSLDLPGSVSFSPDIGATVSYGGDDDDRSKDVFGHASGGMVGSTMDRALSAAAAFGGTFGQASAVPLSRSGESVIADLGMYEQVAEEESGLGFAKGGIVRGPGSGTSDSIRAPWLSDGEYVIPAARVEKVGVEALDDLKDGRAEIGHASGRQTAVGAIARIGFAIGGIARRFAEGGHVKTIPYPMAPPTEWYGEANYRQTGGRMESMSPDEFLSYSRPLEIDEVSRDNIEDLKAHIIRGGKLDPLNLYATGKEDGRHRAVAAKELGIKSVPVINWRPLPPQAAGRPASGLVGKEESLQRQREDLSSPERGFAIGGLVRGFQQGGLVTDDDINHMDQEAAINFLVDHDVMTRNEAGVMTTEDLQDAIRETKWYHPIQDAVTAPSASSSETSSIPTEATDISYPYGHPPSAPASVPFAKPEPPEFVHYRADTGTNPDLAKLQIAYARGKISADELKRGMHISAASGITVPKLPLTNAEKLSRAASIPTSAPSPSGELPTVTYGRVLHVLPENAVMAEGSFKEHNEATIRNLVKTGVWTPERAQWERMNQSAIAQAGKAFGDKPRPLNEETEDLMKAYAGALGKPDYGYDAEGGVHILKQETTPKSSPAPVDLSTPFESLPKGHYQDKMVRDWRGLHTYFTEGFVPDSEAKHEGGHAARRKRRDSDEDMWNPERAGMSLGGLARVSAALGGLAIGFSGGGMIGAPAPASAAPLVAHIQRAAVSPPSDEAMWNPLHSVVGNEGYAMGGLVGGGTGALQPAGYHALDVRTNSGTIPTLVSESGLESIRRDAVLGKAISSGIKPSWWGG